jgi:hypothetical protein
MPEQPSKASSRIGLVITIVLIILGLGLVLFFGVRTYRDYHRLRERGLSPGVTDVEDIRGWMTLRHIARAYGVPEDTLFKGLGVPGAGNEKLSIKQLAKKYDREPAEVRKTVQEIILRYQQTTTPPAEGTP